MLIEIKKDTNSTRPLYYAITQDNDILLSGYYDIELLKADLLAIKNRPDICFISEETTYNGWSNWDTWNTFNWISNDHFTYNHFKEIDVYKFFMEEVKGFIKTINDDIDPVAVNCREIWNALQEI